MLTGIGVNTRGGVGTRIGEVWTVGTTIVGLGTRTGETGLGDGVFTLGTGIVCFGEIVGAIDGILGRGGICVVGTLKGLRLTVGTVGGANPINGGCDMIDVCCLCMSTVFGKTVEFNVRR